MGALDANAAIGAVSLVVSDLDRSIAFYTNALGFEVLEREQGSARLGLGGRELVLLNESPGARRPARATGLYHFAVLFPSRPDLAAALARLATAGVHLHGASDHGVSEALYLADPDGNGIELYRDRPRAEWPRASDGSIQMTIDPIDLEDLLREGLRPASRADALPMAPPETRVGHVHLHVADLDPAIHFYVDVLGFDAVTRYGSEAFFVAVGGYHHHVGLNIWAGRGAPPPPPGSIGLRWFDVEHSSSAEREKTIARLRAQGIGVDPLGNDYLVRDPSRNGIRLTARA